MGGYADRPLQRTDEVAEVAADAGGRQYPHQRGEEHRHHRRGSRYSSNALLLHLCYRCMVSFCQEEALIAALIDVRIDVQN